MCRVRLVVMGLFLHASVPRGQRLRILSIAVAVVDAYQRIMVCRAIQLTRIHRILNADATWTVVLSGRENLPAVRWSLWPPNVLSALTA
jgi:hypothetical protein